ncbi:MAG: glycosyltransferase [Candidatus Kerfeldbacteria bacterium]|nr:glycosyltransferase [Candidatus Kerfeldbacteria bacterium]
MNVALVHEHLAQDGGAERVAQVLMDMFPQAPLFTLVYNPRRANPAFRDRDIRTSFIQRLPGGVRYYQWFVTLMPNAVERYDLRGFDLVISSASAFAKGVITDPRALHLCYLHSPTRYLWSDTHQYVDELPYPRWIRALIPLSLTRLRMWDRLAADRVDHFVANSRAVQQRIKKYYRRDSAVIYPPVDLQRFTLHQGGGDYYLTGGRLVPYKRFDLAIQAFNKLGLPLKIFGVGPAMTQLQTMAKKNIDFLGRVPDQDLNELYGRAAAFLYPQEEDFGITAVEAMATGRPVIAYAAGGALESVKAGQTGVFFQEQEWEALADTVIRFQRQRFDPHQIRRWALGFGVDRFRQELRRFVDQTWQTHQAQLP